jgi:hypothetical protein
MPFDVLTEAQVQQTAAAIAAAQQPCGSLPWPDGHTDAWDHVECCMALLLGGREAEALRGWDWLLQTQFADGSWATKWDQLDVLDPLVDVNQGAYVAVGAWHWWLVTQDSALPKRTWPMVKRALDLVLDSQTPRGEILWAREGGVYRQEALLTGSSSMYQSLRCGLALADLLGDPQPEWELAAGRLQHAVAHHPEAFLDKSRFSMDWYYPVLGGCVRGPAALELLDAQWETFVWPGLGIRCVSDRPWITGAETAELVMAMLVAGRADEARALMVDVQHLRHEDGSYWTGLVMPEDVHWPGERSSWTAAAMVLAADALGGGPTLELFSGSRLPTGALLGESCTLESADRC